MAPRRKPVVTNKPENLVQSAANAETIKIEPIRDIEDIIKSEPTTSPYFSPIQTRNQRLTNSVAEAVTLKKIKPISSLARQVESVSPNNNAPKDKPKKQTAKESKKARELKSIFENLKNLPEVEESPIEIVVKQEPEPVAVKPKKPRAKRVPKTVEKALKAEPVDEVLETNSIEIPLKEAKPPTSPVKVTKRKSKDASKSPETKLEKWEPSNWRQILDNIRVMRASVPAPVDTMGCDQCSDENADEKTRRFHVLLALMLSSQTKDEVTHEAMRRLTSEGNCTPQAIADMETQKLETLLYPVSFYKNKAKYLKNTSNILIEQYESDIPNDIKGLIKLPGVGPKMAHICMNSAWNIVTGIGVDVHVHRISNRLGWVRQETKQPEQTRKELESWLPSDFWKEVNHLLVGFGQTICTPVKPKCGECLNKAICPAAFAVKPKKVKAEKVVV